MFIKAFIAVAGALSVLVAGCAGAPTHNADTTYIKNTQPIAGQFYRDTQALSWLDHRVSIEDLTTSEAHKQLATLEENVQSLGKQLQAVKVPSDMEHANTELMDSFGYLMNCLIATDEALQTGSMQDVQAANQYDIQANNAYEGWNSATSSQTQKS